MDEKGCALAALPEYGCLVLVMVLYCFLNVWMDLEFERVLELPGNYAYVFHTDDIGWNESLRVCAGLGLFYIMTRYFYFTGYAMGNHRKRLSIGKYGLLSFVGLTIRTISFGVNLLVN